MLRALLLRLNCLLLAAAALSGCSKSSGPSGASHLTPGEAKASLESAFKAGDPAAQKQAAEVQDAIKRDDEAKALFQLNEMSSNRSLTPEQRKVVLESQSAVSAGLRKKAEQGDKQAAEALQVYQATK